MDKNLNPFAEDEVPIEKSLAALYEWLLTYGYRTVNSAMLFNTNLDFHLSWAKCEYLGILRHDDIPDMGYYLTPQVHDYLERYANGH